MLGWWHETTHPHEICSPSVYEQTRGLTTQEWDQHTHAAAWTRSLVCRWALGTSGDTALLYQASEGGLRPIAVRCKEHKGFWQSGGSRTCSRCPREEAAPCLTRTLAVPSSLIPRKSHRIQNADPTSFKQRFFHGP